MISLATIFWGEEALEAQYKAAYAAVADEDSLAALKGKKGQWFVRMGRPVFTNGMRAAAARKENTDTKRVYLRIPARFAHRVASATRMTIHYQYVRRAPWEPTPLP